MHEYGYGVEVNEAKSFLYYTFASNENHDAKMVLAYRYFEGIGVKRSCEKALEYYRVVANEGINLQIFCKY